jgi:hypothetical protein
MRLHTLIGLGGRFVNFCGFFLVRGIARTCRWDAFNAGSEEDLVLLGQLGIPDCGKVVAKGNMWGDMPISLISTAIVTTDYRSLPLLLTLITLSLD